MEGVKAQAASLKDTGGLRTILRDQGLSLYLWLDVGQRASIIWEIAGV